MKIRIYSLLLCGFALGSLSALAQQSPLLEKYRTMALDYNHDLKAAEKNIAASMEVEKSARADLKPKLSGTANFQYTENPLELTLDVPSLGLSRTVEGKQLNYGGSLSILQPVYTGGRVLESIRMAQHQQSFAANQAKALNDAVCYQTDIQYWSAVARQEIVTVAEDFRNSIAALVKTIKERVEVGLVDPQDLLMAEAFFAEQALPALRVGQGYDVHRLVEGRPLILCGVTIPHTLGLLGHSDADVALHALMDAMLGAMALGDIGKHFPDTDEAYRGISSMLLLRHVVALLKAHHARVTNCDVTIVAQKPKLLPYIPQMRQNVADVLELPLARVNIKATTTEKLGFEGEEKGISAQAVCMVQENG